MMKKAILSFSILFGLHFYAQNETSTDSINRLDEVILQATRIQKTDPFTQTNLSKSQLEIRNLGQDVPILFNYLPNIVTTSDAGGGVGYTGLRVRGSDATRVNVTINGIPLNDSESHSVYWVDIPDIVSSTRSVQLQRGVGTSTNGSGAFGASLNLLTDGYNEQPKIQISNSFGSFNTRKHNLQFQSGILGEHFSFSGRLSAIHSDGYIERASSNLKSYFFNAAYTNNNTLIKFVSFGGSEITYQAWYGIDQQKLTENPTFNYAGALYDENWNITGFYDNQVDDYKQNHYQLHFNQHLTNTLDIAAALHYTKGSGYYEEYKQGEEMTKYGISPISIHGNTVTTTDLIRQKWLSNDFYGLTFSIKYAKNDNSKFILGGGINTYDGDHSGKVIWARFASNSEINHPYYFNNGLKKEGFGFAKWQYQLAEKWKIFADVQVRNITYKTQDFLTPDIDKNWTFFNPKAGLTYQINTDNQIYTSFARANREPLRDDFELATAGNEPLPEQLDDYELGWRWNTEKQSVQMNAYYMNYKNQLVLTGARTDVGDYIRANSGNSYRIGIEIEADLKLHSKWNWQPNIAVSQNKNLNFFDAATQTYLQTDISYSPNLVAGSQIMYSPFKNLQGAILNKYVGKQYLNNLDSENALLKAYFITDLQVQWAQKEILKLHEIKWSAVVNNIFNEHYISNGYMWETTAYYFPQAGTHFLVGLEVSF